jgi:hypothetical protein
MILEHNTVIQIFPIIESYRIFSDHWIWLDADQLFNQLGTRDEIWFGFFQKPIWFRSVLGKVELIPSKTDTLIHFLDYFKFCLGSIWEFFVDTSSWKQSIVLWITKFLMFSSFFLGWTRKWTAKKRRLYKRHVPHGVIINEDVMNKTRWKTQYSVFTSFHLVFFLIKYCYAFRISNDVVEANNDHIY